MRNTIRKVCTGLAAAGLTVLLAGCQADGGKPQAATASTQGVTCNKCQTTWVQVPRYGEKAVMAYSTQKRHECPDCRSAVDNFFRTGNLEHTCKTCGDAIEICEAH